MSHRCSCQGAARRRRACACGSPSAGADVSGHSCNVRSWDADTPSVVRNAASVRTPCNERGRLRLYKHARTTHNADTANPRAQTRMKH
eukprot:10589210-Alexandrium_andersonii.AAC.1